MTAEKQSLFAEECLKATALKRISSVPSADVLTGLSEQSWWPCQQQLMGLQSPACS